MNLIYNGANEFTENGKLQVYTFGFIIDDQKLYTFKGSAWKEVDTEIELPKNKSIIYTTSFKYIDDNLFSYNGNNFRLNKSLKLEINGEVYTYDHTVNKWRYNSKNLSTTENINAKTQKISQEREQV